MDIQWPLVVFGLLAGCGGATLAFVGLSEFLGIGRNARRPAALAALALLMVGGCASVAHLAQPANIMAAAANVLSLSGISVELIMLGVNVVVTVAYLLATRSPGAVSKIVGAVGVVCGLGLAFCVGNGYVMDAQPLWNTPLLPLAYLGNGLACGGCLFLALVGASAPKPAEGADPAATAAGPAADTARIRPFVLGAVAIEALAFLAYGAFAGFAVDALLFWGGAMAVGCGGAAACLMLVDRRSAAAWAAFACALAGGMCFRAAMWLLGTGFLSLFATAASRTLL